MLAVLGKLPTLALSPSPSTAIPANALFVNSGLARATLTRTKVVTYTIQSAARSDARDGGPDVVTALLDADLRDPSTKSQFPASQIQLSASPIGVGRLQISAVINPARLQDAGGGSYRGTIQVFAGSQVVRVPLIVYLAPRDGTPAVFAFLLLLAGAIVGLGVKWITESLSRLAAARWRLDDLRRKLGGNPSNLPLMAAVQLEELEERIRRQDTDELDKAFAPLLSDVLHLSSFAAAIRAARQELDEQGKLADDLDEDEVLLGGVDRGFIESIARTERTEIERFRAGDWPWTDPKKTVTDVQELADQCAAATSALGDAIADRSNSSTFEVLDLFRKKEFRAAADLFRNPPPEDAPADTPTKASDRRAVRTRLAFGSRPEVIRRFLPSGGEGLVPWMAQRPRSFAGAASVLVVSVVGLQLQYLGVDDFGGGLGDWLGLLLWAAVVELSGVSVLDVLSRLGGGNLPGGGSSRRAPSPAPNEPG